MGDLFHEKADRDLFFSSFANDIGTQLDQLKFEFEEIESGKLKVEPEVKAEDKVDSSRLESRVQNEIERNLSDGAASEHDKDHRSRTFTMMRAFSTVSLMANFKTGFWRRKRGSKKNNENKGRRGSTTSNPENNNNPGLPKIHVSGESEGRSTIYSTVPRQPKNGNRNQILSPTRTIDPDMPEQLHRTESGNVFVPPVIIDGQVVHDYQYVTPESSPKHNEGKFYRRNSLSRLFRIRKSPKRSPKKPTTPIKQLYEKTVLTASNNELNRVQENGTHHQNGVANGAVKAEPRKPLAST